MTTETTTANRTPITRERILEAARKAAAESGGYLSRRKFEKLSGISTRHVYLLFENGWCDILKALGMQRRHLRARDPRTDEELLAEYHRIVTELGQLPTMNVFSYRSKMSDSILRRRLGGRPGIHRRYHAWLKEREPESPLLHLFRPAGFKRRWPKLRTNEYGAPMELPGFRYAPTNEKGVIYLFGILAKDLGFEVEALHLGYPDCEAKRVIDKRTNRWQSIRLEFEFASKNFVMHAHDPQKCDLIVCWEHDWPECPVEVVELRRVVRKLIRKGA